MNVQEAALRREVVQELEWEPRLGSSVVDVGVAAHGVVTLSGVVKSYAEKVAAERAAKRVRGVRAVVNDVDVNLPMSHERNDADIAAAVVQAHEWNVLVPHDAIESRVSDGWVRLEGAVDWNYQRAAAEEGVQHLAGAAWGAPGVTAVDDELAIDS